MTDGHSPTENAAQRLGAKDRQSLALLVTTARDRELRLAHVHLLVDLPQTYSESRGNPPVGPGDATGCSIDPAGDGW